MTMILSFRRIRTITHLTAALALAGTIGCSALDVNSPTTVRVDDIENGGGAVIAVNGIREYVKRAEQIAITMTGSLADEFGLGEYDDHLNYRKEDIWVGNDLYPAWQQVYRRATQSLAIIRASGPGVSAQISEALSLRGYSLLSLGEQICPGYPVIQLDIDGERITPVFTSDPQTPDSSFARALADFDSALAYASGDARVSNFARVGKGRALLGLGRFAEAAAAVAGVPLAYQDSMMSQYTLYFAFDNIWGGGYSVQEREGTNGLNFVSANDPRVTLAVHLRESDTLYAPYKYYHDNFYFPQMVLASGVEARLIVAEAALHDAPDGGAWLDTLNVLRRTIALADTTDPGTADGRTDLLFRERAFWLFATAHRLGDLRRLVARYGRAPEEVFPVGPAYGTATSIPFDGVLEHNFNSKITGCTSL